MARNGRLAADSAALTASFLYRMSTIPKVRVMARGDGLGGTAAWGVRLEQERIGFGWVPSALAAHR